MTQSAKHKHVSRPAGRPAIEDRDQILAYFTQGQANGATIAELAKWGLAICGYRFDARSGSWRIACLRHLTGKTLERRYREHRSRIREELASLEVAACGTRAVTTAMPVAYHPFSFDSGRTPKRGRPKNAP